MNLRALGREAWATIYQTVDEFMRDDCVNMAAGLAFYTVFSLAPLIVVVLKLTGLFLSPELIEGQIEDQVRQLVGSAGARQVREILSTVDATAEGGDLASILGLLATVFASTTVLAQLQTALNRAWGVRPSPGADIRQFVNKRLLSLAMVVTLTILLVSSLVVSSFVRAWTLWVIDLVPSTLDSITLELLDVGVSWVVFSLLFAAMYKVLPDAEITWRDVAVGSVVTAALFVLGKELISLYLGRSAFGSSYGAAASLAVILAWVFYSSVILLLGAEFTQVWTRRRGRTVVPEPCAELADDDERAPPEGALPA